MRKILIAFDSDNFSEAALGFAQQLNEKNPILLTAAFLPQVDLAYVWSYSPGGYAGTSYIPLVEDEEAESIKENIRKVESFCIKNHIEYRIHKDFFDLAAPALKKETRFADLLIISSSSFYEQIGSEKPNEYLREILHQSECPVIVVPEEFDFPASNVLAYDGSETSVYAIKQFAYLFPELAGNETILVYFRENEEKKLPDEINIEELAARHFSNLTLLRMQGNPHKYLSTWLMDKKNSMLVTGSYGRSDISRMFKKSFAAEAISDHKLPVFIAHK